MQSPPLIPARARLFALIGIMAGLLLLAGASTASADFEKPVILSPSALGGNVSPSPNCISVNWSHSGSGVVGFSVERENPYWGDDRIGADQRSLFVCGMEPSTTYRFKVCAYFGTEDGDVECSDWVELRTSDPEQSPAQQRPPAPRIVSHEAGETWVRICWLADFDYDSYFVNHEEKGVPGTLRTIDHENGGGQGCQRVDGLQPGRTYILGVQGCHETLFGIGSDRCYDWSAGYEVSTLRFANAIDQLAAPVITTTEAGETWIAIAWTTTPTTHRHNYDQFNIKYSVKPAPGEPPTPPTTDTEDGAVFSHTAHNLQPGTTYVFSVQGCDLNLGLNGPPGVDCGGWGPEREATTNTPTPASGFSVPAVLNPAQGAVTAGNTLKLDGQYFPPNGGTVTLSWGGPTGAGSLGTATITAEGTFSTTVTIPADLAPGSYNLHAEATNAKADATVQVLASSSQRTLTVTSSGGQEETSLTVYYPYTLTGNNFAPLFDVTIHLDSKDGPELGTVTAALDGTITMDLRVTPDQIGNRYGDHKLVAETNGFNLAERTYTFVPDIDVR